MRQPCQASNGPLSYGQSRQAIGATGKIGKRNIMNVHVKPKYLSEAKSLKIARAIFAGASHKEVAEENGVSVRQVQIAVERIRRMIAACASVIPQIGRGGNIVRLDEHAKKRKPVVWEPASKAARELGIKAVRTKRGVPSVPYVSILHGRE